MDFKPTAHQSALVAEAQAALAARSPEMASQEQIFDAPLWRSLQGHGLLNLAAQGEHAGLDAALVTETLSLGNAMVPYAVRALVGSLFRDEDMATRPVAIMRDSHDVPVRFATFCPLLVVIDQDGDEARLCQAPDAQPSRSNYITPMGRFLGAPGTVLATVGAGDAMRRWQIAIGAEIVGAMQGVLDSIVAYLSEREQFGRKLASFQALQHRLAELAVGVETSRWLVRSAAYHDRNDLAAMAATHAAVAARRLCTEAHQLAGARGYTIAFGLHRWTLRLQALSLEAGGGRTHSLMAAERWDEPNRKVA